MDKVRDWCNKYIKHDRDDVGDFGYRLAMHIPVGFINALFVLVHWVLVPTFMYLFWKYQRNEDAHTEDEAWKDVYGWLIGFAIGCGLLLILWGLHEY